MVTFDLQIGFVVLKKKIFTSALLKTRMDFNRRVVANERRYHFFSVLENLYI